MYLWLALVLELQHLTSAVTARRFRAELHAPRKHPEIKKKKKKKKIKAVENKKNVTVSQQLPIWLYNSKPRQLNCLTKIKNNNKKTILLKETNHRLRN